MAEIVSTGSSTIRRLTRLIALDEGVYAATISENATFGQEAPNILRLNGGSSNRTVAALAELEVSGQCRGPYLWHNSGTTHNLVYASSAAATIVTLTPGESAIGYWSGSAWAASKIPGPAPAAISAATGTAIPVAYSGSLAVTTAAAETNTLADPTFLGQTLTIFVDTYAVGDRVITAASRINQTGNTVITLGAVGDFIKLEAITIAGALKWQVIANDGAALS